MHEFYKQILTPQEQVVAGLICEAKSEKEIARELDLGGPTVKFHKRRIFKKLQVKSQTEAALVLVGHLRNEHIKAREEIAALINELAQSMGPDAELDHRINCVIGSFKKVTIREGNRTKHVTRYFGPRANPEGAGAAGAPKPTASPWSRRTAAKALRRRMIDIETGRAELSIEAKKS